MKNDSTLVSKAAEAPSKPAPCIRDLLNEPA
jgi:hypothetical protein